MKLTEIQIPSPAQKVFNTLFDYIKHWLSGPTLATVSSEIEWLKMLEEYLYKRMRGKKIAQTSAFYDLNQVDDELLPELVTLTRNKIRELRRRSVASRRVK